MLYVLASFVNNNIYHSIHFASNHLRSLLGKIFLDTHPLFFSVVQFVLDLVGNTALKAHLSKMHRKD